MATVTKVGGKILFYISDADFWYIPCSELTVTYDKVVKTVTFYHNDKLFWSVKDKSKVTNIVSTSLFDLSNQIAALTCDPQIVEQGAPPHNFGYPPLKVSFEYLNPQTNTAVLTPSAGKKWVVTDIIFSVDGVNDVEFFDETNTTANLVIKVRSGNERFFNHAFRIPIVSSAANNVLRVTSTKQSDFRGTIIYYEID